MGFRKGRQYAITWCKKAEKAREGWKGDRVKALECYDEAIKRDPTFAKPWYEKGKIFATSPELPGSWMWCHVISPYITGRPHPPYPEVGPMPDKYHETLKLFNKATELDPKFVDAWFAKGDFYFGYVDGEDDALECYDKAIALDPKYEPAWSGKAKVLAKLGKHKEALKCSDKAITLLPADAKDDNDEYFVDRLCEKADTLAASGKHNEAIKCYDEIIEMKYQMKKDYALGKKGIVLAKLGKHEEALKCYDEATKSEFFRSGLDEIEMNLAKADALSELGGSQERMLKYYSLAIRQCANELMDRQAKPVTEYHWEKGVKKLEEICSQAIKGLKK